MKNKNETIKTENRGSRFDQVTTEEMTDVISKAQSECAEMRGIALSTVGKNLNEILSRVSNATRLSRRFDTAYELMSAAEEIKTIVKILLIDSFWLDDISEDVILDEGARRQNKSEFMYVFRDFAGICGDIHDMIKGRC